jgi:hypothetical protein
MLLKIGRDSLTNMDAVLVDMDVRLSFTEIGYEEMIEFMLDIGRCLGYYKMPSTNSWSFAAKSFQLREFCRTLWSRIHGVFALESSEADDNDNSPQETDNDINSAATTTSNPISNVWQPQALGNTFLRLCVFRTWGLKYLNSATPYNETAMMNEWLEEAISMYETLASTVWAVKRVPLKILPEWRKTITHTVKNTWMVHMQNNSREGDSNAPPMTAFETDCFLAPRRAAWQAYYSCIIQMRRVAKVNTSRRPEAVSVSTKKGRIDALVVSSATPGTTSLTTSSASSTESTSGSSPSVRAVNDLTQFDSSEIDAQIALLEKRNEEQHTEVLKGQREQTAILMDLLGEFKTITRALTQPQQGVSTYHQPPSHHHQVFHQEQRSVASTTGSGAYQGGPYSPLSSPNSGMMAAISAVPHPGAMYVATTTTNLLTSTPHK